MNVPSRNEPHDLETGEITSGLPVGFADGNQSLAVSIARAEVDQQITTAHAYPRSVTRAVQNILSLATLDEETAKECIYALPRGGKAIKGPSIRLAEIIASQWGNSRIGTRITHVDRIEKYVEAEAVFHDLETNVAMTARVRRRLTAERKSGQITEDMIIVTGNAASSIARRNAILAAVPKAVWRPGYTAVERVLTGDVKTLTSRRDEAMKAFAAFGVKPEQIFDVLEKGGLDDIGLDDMATLLGMHAALKSGESTVEEMFPAKKATADKDKPKDIGSRLDDLASKKNTNTDAGSPAGAGAAAKSDGQANTSGPAEEPSSPREDGSTNQESAPTRNHAPETAGAAAASGSTSEPGAATDQTADDVKAIREGRAAYRRGLARKANPYTAEGDDQTNWFKGFDEEADNEPEPGSEG